MCNGNEIGVGVGSFQATFQPFTSLSPHFDEGNIVTSDCLSCNLDLKNNSVSNFGGFFLLFGELAHPP